LDPDPQLEKMLDPDPNFTRSYVFMYRIVFIKAAEFLARWQH
jgi:hypothetical protein